MTLPPLQGWLPMHAGLREGRLETELCWFGERRLLEPFFDDSLAAVMQQPFNAVFRHRLPIETLAQWLEVHPGLPPRGFVFHMSRCGSTLLGQVLAASAARRVVSEAAPIDAVLRVGAAVDDATRGAWLRTMLGMLGQPADAAERSLYVKFDSWHTHHLPLVATVHPEVPWVFLIREPVEVIVSHLRRPGAQMVPGMLGFTLPGLDPVAAATLPRAEYIARMLGWICEAAEQALLAEPGRGLVVDYADWPATLEGALLPHFGLRTAGPEAAAMQAALRRDAKNPSFDFAPDAESKRRDAGAEVHAAAERWVQPVYRRLLALARGGAASPARRPA
ncbi:MAG: hypothetical protein KGN16_11635 [Burkholderiales bacterium]|nr:hypothetical protein [Burkholderiales bacterium]